VIYNYLLKIPKVFDDAEAKTVDLKKYGIEKIKKINK